MWNLKRKDTNELTKQKETHKLREQGLGGRMGGRDSWGVWMDMYTLLYLKWITNKDLLYSTWNSAQGCVAAGMGGEFGGEWIHVYVWLSPFTFDLKLSQGYTLIQNKKLKKKKRKKNTQAHRSAPLLLNCIFFLFLLPCDKNQSALDHTKWKPDQQRHTFSVMVLKGLFLTSSQILTAPCAKNDTDKAR